MGVVLKAKGRIVSSKETRVRERCDGLKRVASTAVKAKEGECLERDANGTRQELRDS